MKSRSTFILLAGLLVLSIGGVGHGQSDLCNNLDMKPVLSIEQINMSDLADFIVQIDPNLERPAASSPEDLYRKEVQLLMAAGYPPIFGETPPDTLVTRRLFAQIMFQIAVNTDTDFASKYGNLTNETDMLQALVAENWLYATQGNLYREEVLSVLCKKLPQKPIIAIDIVPEMIIDADLEAPGSPI